MEFKQENIWPVPGFKEEQDLGVFFSSEPVEQEMAEGPPRKFFSITMDGDIVVDDGHTHWAMHEVELDVMQAIELHGELYRWLTETMQVHFSPIILAHLRKQWVPSPSELAFIDPHDQSIGPGLEIPKDNKGNDQDDSSGPKVV